MAIPGVVIETIESRWGQSIELMYDTPESQQFRPDPCVWPAFLNVGASMVGHFRPPTGRVKEPTVTVRVNCGVWQTVCPFCPSAQHASRDDPWFYCARCHNEPVGLALIPVIWPDGAGDIEEVLLKRDLIDYRSWEADQPVKELVNENLELAAGLVPPLLGGPRLILPPGVEDES